MVNVPGHLERTRMLLGDEAIGRLRQARVIVFGVGGVGGHAAEALVRCGVGHIDVVDDDVVSVTNINRQVIATSSTVGRPKVDVMAERLRDIDPTCEVTAHRCFYLPQNADEFDLSRYDYVVDAVDTITAKLHLVSQAKAAGTPVISSMGAANKLDPTAFRVADIEETSICPLARIMRKEARKRGLGHFKVVFSVEPARKPEGAIEALSEERPGSSRRSMPGSVSFVPPAAGMALAGAVVMDLVAG